MRLASCTGNLRSRACDRSSALGATPWDSSKDLGADRRCSQTKMSMVPESSTKTPISPLNNSEVLVLVNPAGYSGAWFRPFLQAWELHSTPRGQNVRGMDKSHPLLPAGQWAANRSDTVLLANNGKKDTRWPVVDKESTKEGTARRMRDQLSFEPQGFQL